MMFNLRPMKTFILFLSAVAIYTANAQVSSGTTVPSSTTVREAKDKCKAEGKEGKALLDCIRAQTETK